MNKFVRNFVRNLIFGYYLKLQYIYFSFQFTSYVFYAGAVWFMERNKLLKKQLYISPFVCIIFFYSVLDKWWMFGAQQRYLRCFR